MAFCLLLSSDPLCRASDSYFINLVDGSSGCGQLVGITDDGSFLWQNEGFVDSFEFPLECVRSLTATNAQSPSDFLDQIPALFWQSPSRGIWLIHSRGAIRLAGTPTGLNDQHLQLNSPSLGSLKIDRQMALQITRYASLWSNLGPTVNSKNWKSSGTHSDWEFTGQGFSSRVRGATISTPISASQSTEYHMRIRWEGTANFLIGFGGKHHARLKIAGRAVQIEGDRLMRPAAHHDGTLAIEAWAGKLFFVQESGRSIETTTIGDFGDESGTLDLILCPESSVSPAQLQIVGGPRFELKRNDKMRGTNIEELVIRNQGRLFALDRIQVAIRSSGVGSNVKALLSQLLIEGSPPTEGGIRSWDFHSGTILAETAAPATLVELPEKSLISARILPASDAPQSGQISQPNRSDRDGMETLRSPASNQPLGDYFVGLKDGTRILGTLLHIRHGHLAVAVPGISPTLDIPVDSIAELNPAGAPTDSTPPIIEIGTSESTLAQDDATESITLDQSILLGTEAEAVPEFVGTAFVGRSQLKGRLVSSRNHSSEGGLYWKPILSRTASQVILGVSAELRGGRALSESSSRAALQAEPRDDSRSSWMAVSRGGHEGTTTRQASLPAMIELSSGDQILATIAKVDQQGVHFQSPLTSVTQLPHAWVRSVRFREVFAGPVMTREQKRRLLTVQGSRRSDPPTHLIVSNTGDTLRGNLVSLSEGVLSAEIRSRMVQLSVGQIAEIIWLFDRSSESKPMEDIHHVQIVSSGATTTLHDQVRVEHGMLIGTSRMFGDVQIPLDHLSMIAIGCEPIEDDYELNFE